MCMHAHRDDAELPDVLCVNCGVANDLEAVANVGVHHVDGDESLGRRGVAHPNHHNLIRPSTCRNTVKQTSHSSVDWLISTSPPRHDARNGGEKKKNKQSQD